MAFLEILQQAFIQQLSQAQEVAFIQQASVLRQWVQHGTTHYNTVQCYTKRNIPGINHFCTLRRIIEASSFQRYDSHAWKGLQARNA
jgi:hypothetical protein